MHAHYDVMHKLGMQILTHIAEGLGKPVNYFDKWFVNNTLSTMRLIRYLPRNSNIVDYSKLSTDELKLTTPPHADSGFLTLLSTYDYPGLEVDIGNETYKPVIPRPGSIVVNVGKMLSRITNGTLKGTRHRVVDIGRERYSSPFFLEPHYAAAIPTFLTEG